MNPRILLTVLFFVVFSVFLAGCDWVEVGNGQRADDEEMNKRLPRSSSTELELPRNDANEEAVILTSPQPNAEVSPPLKVTGRARGRWYFEASFPVRLVDDKGRELASAPAQAQGEWMQEGFVPFEAVFTEFYPGTAREGKLILEKDNPSGLAKYIERFEIPVRFAAAESMTLNVFFGNREKDPDMMDCSLVFPRHRVIPKTKAVARAALEELLKGTKGPSTDEAFYFTSIGPNVKVQKLVIENGVAKVDFNYALESENPGLCAGTAAMSQIRETLLQFPTIKDVVISIDGRTEDILQP